MAGYSKRSLIEKLGLKEGMRVYIVAASKVYESELTAVKDQIERSEQLIATVDFIHYFTKSKEELEKSFPLLAKNLNKNGLLWISWPKGSSKIPNDLNENIIRVVGLTSGLVDVKVIAVDEDWSGLKFVYRLKDR